MIAGEHFNSTSRLLRQGGSIGYSRSGSGSLVVLAPGMGDLRQSYRFIVPDLVQAGHEVVTTDLRGHGDSDATFAVYGDEATADDLTALIEHLGRPAILVGNSMAAGAAVIAASRRPDLVEALVLLGPFVRDRQNPWPATLAMRFLMAPAWAATVWNAYLPSLYAGRKPEDLADYRRAVTASMRRPGFASAFSKTTRTSHAIASSLVGTVQKPTLVIMGEQDPDFPDPSAEAAWIGSATNGTVVMVPEAGHYPQAQQPEATVAALLPFLSGIAARG